MSTDAGTYGEQFGQEFQRHLLAVASRHDGFALRFRSALSHTYFTAEIERTIARALLEYVDKYEGLPTQSTLVEAVRPYVDSDEMDPYEKAVKKLFADDVSDAKAVIDRAVEFGKQQAMCNAVLEAAELVDKGERPKVMPVIQDALLVGEDILDVGIDYTGNAEDRGEWYLDPVNRDSVPTGIIALDVALEGGLGPGELGVVLAPPKRGKSTTLINFGYGALTRLNPKTGKGYNVLHYTAEMADYKVARRYDDRLAADWRKPVKPTLTDDEKKDIDGAVYQHLGDFKKTDPAAYVEKLKAWSKSTIKGRLFIKQYPTRTASVSTIKSHIALLQAHGFVPDILLVDYADILKAERRLGEHRHEVAGVYEDLRGIAGELAVPVWTGSQSNRASLEKKEDLTMADFAEAFETAAIMDVGIAFCQDFADRTADRPVCKFVIVGARDQEDGRFVPCEIRRDRCLIRSTGLYSPTHNPIPVEGLALTEEQERANAAIRREGKRQFKGEKAKKPHKKLRNKVPTKGKTKTKGPHK
jgi:replicative DNA helicase